MRHSEAQLAQSQKLEAVGRLAGGLAHDINNYVTAITSQCELVRMKAEPRVAEKMDMVIATAGKITSLVRRLLAFSRQQPMAVRVIGLNEVVERLRTRKPDLAVLFMSGYTDNVVVRHGILEGELEFLEKPFSAARLAGKVREVLGAGP